MGFVVNLIDLTLFLFFLVIALAAPLIDAQTLLPHTYFPRFFVDLKNWYSSEYGDFLVAEKPHFFVGLVWLELLFQWPLALLNLYGIFGCKALVAILSEMIGSKRASDKLLMMYFPFMGLGVLATLRGLFSHFTGTFSNVGKRPAVPRKKRA